MLNPVSYGEVCLLWSRNQVAGVGPSGLCRLRKRHRRRKRTITRDSPASPIRLISHEIQTLADSVILIWAPGWRQDQNMAVGCSQYF